MSQDIKTKIQNLTKTLQFHNERYYFLDAPTISDVEFDKKLKELEALEKKYPQYQLENSPTKRVGGSLTENFKTISHENRMYSLENSYDENDLLHWEKRIKKIVEMPITYTCELKYDGASLSITYESGNFLRAVTRGDGLQGDEVSQNIKTIPSIPLKFVNFLDNFDVRGEVVLPFKGFEAMNKKRIENGEPPYANPRNTASGSLKLLDSKEVAKRPLECLIYQVIPKDKTPYKTHAALLNKARASGFKIPDTLKIAKNMQEVLDFIKYWDKKRADLPYETDGVVIKVNELAAQEELGYTSKFPRWAMAYKFKTQQVATFLESVDYQVGRTGAITPVANLKPVALGGTIVKRASLHNSEQMQKLNIELGDCVFVEKGGEIIPKIVAVDMSKRKNTKPIKFAKHCPECETLLVKMEEDAKHYCPNEKKCPPQVIGKIEHYISRNALNMESLGGETIKLLYKKNIIKNYPDLYELKKEDLLPLERMAEKSIANILKAIENSKKIPFEKVLFGIGIRFVGETVAQKLAYHFESMDNILNAKFEDLIAADEIGEKIAKSVMDFTKDSEKMTLIKRLKKYGVQMKIAEKSKTKSRIFEEKIFVISGIFEKISRTELKKIIEENAGKTTTSISKKTDYIVAGKNMGPSKLEKAQKLKIPLLSEKDFFEMIKQE